MNAKTDNTTNEEPRHPLSANRTPRWRSLLLGAVIFISGIIIGAGVSIGIAWRANQIAYQKPERVVQRIYSRANQFLDLTSEQEPRIKAIMQNRLHRILEIRSEILPVMQEELHAMRDEVAAELTGEQKERWIQRFEVMERLWLPVSTPEENSD